ncbi:hypothetical protein PsorP6_008840 [Peronosclerospora sorghi]|uniref:Uncharacterized protein n=1 Tax=Peronosclerospora sorghi TaxID=230839 RepID=A0ACC0W1E3_9STRA|nr:hypothetical protein PsorP6_008840 [Peronosclerospora sorghi]
MALFLSMMSVIDVALRATRLIYQNRVVTLEEGEAAASQYGCRFIGTSSCSCRNGSLSSSFVLVGVVEMIAKNTNGALKTIALNAFMVSVNRECFLSFLGNVSVDSFWIAALTQKMLMDWEKTLAGWRQKEISVIQ